MVNKKSFKIIWDKHALNDFKEILNYLSEQSSQAPKIVKRAILSRINSIKSNALICEIDKLKDLPNIEFRAFVVFSYRITYKIQSERNEIYILRIRHTSREPFGY